MPLTLYDLMNPNPDDYAEMNLSGTRRRGGLLSLPIIKQLTERLFKSKIGPAVNAFVAFVVATVVGLFGKVQIEMSGEEVLALSTGTFAAVSFTVSALVHRFVGIDISILQQDVGALPDGWAGPVTKALVKQQKFDLDDLQNAEREIQRKEWCAIRELHHRCDEQEAIARRISTEADRQESEFRKLRAKKLYDDLKDGKIGPNEARLPQEPPNPYGYDFPQDAPAPENEFAKEIYHPPGEAEGAVQA